MRLPITPSMPVAKLIAFSVLMAYIPASAEDVPKKAFIRKYSNQPLGIRAFNFTASGKCSIILDADPMSNKADTYHCTWKQEGQTNKLIVTWLSEKYKKINQIPTEGDIHYLILNGDSEEAREYCLVRKPTEFDSQKLQNYDIMELSNGTPLCSPKQLGLQTKSIWERYHESDTQDSPKSLTSPLTSR